LLGNGVVIYKSKKIDGKMLSVAEQERHKPYARDSLTATESLEMPEWDEEIR